MSHPELLLSNQLCFLIHRLDRVMVERYRPLLARLGLTYPQYLAMLALWEHGELGIGELCAILDLDTGTVSPLVKRLEAAGLVERRRRSDDERAVTVRLTEPGRLLEARARMVPGALSKCLLAGPEEYAAVKETLQKLLSRVVTMECTGREGIAGTGE